MARSQTEVLSMLNGSFALQPFLIQWQNIFYRTSIHTTGTCPRFYPLRYNETSGYALGTAQTTPTWWINANYDLIFDTYLLNRYPREPQITREYRKSVYRPYQMAPLLEAINSLSACIFGDSKYTLLISDTEDQKYIDGKNFSGKTFVGYFEWMFKAICEDPNSLFVVKPKVSRKETGTMVEPEIIHIPSAEILYISEDEVVYYEPFSDRQYAWWITDTGYFRFKREEDGKTYVNADGVDDGYYAHLLNRKPIHIAGGIWNTLRYYDSYLKAALPFCDDFVSAHSDVQMVNKEACFPFIQMVQTDCPGCNAHGEVQFCNTCHHKGSQCVCESENKDFSRIACPDCNGAKFIMSFNPGQRVMVPKDMADKELLKIINFDVNINKHLQETADLIKAGIKSSLHQQTIDEAQSGKAKEIDREAEYLYRSMVSNGVWNLIESCLIDVLSIRHTQVTDGERKPEIPQYELVKPTDFALKTEFDLLEEMKESKDADIPEYVIKKQLEQYVDKVFGGSDYMKRKVSLINQMDPFAVTPMIEKSAMLASNAITIDAFSFSNNLPTILDKIKRERGTIWFVNAPYDEIEALVKKENDTIEKPEPPETTETVVKVNE